jgi:hypothetical protein
MSREEARQHIRAAQEAELSGRAADAAVHLEHAAKTYLRMGVPARAVALYQHALRLVPGKKTLQAGLEKAQAAALDLQETNAAAPSLAPGAELAQALAAVMSAEAEASPASHADAPDLAGPLRRWDDAALPPSAAPPEPPPPASEPEPDEPLRRDRRALSPAELQRVPVLAPPELDAWCSFCCRPRAEVGPLAQGPAGAFVCRSCAHIVVGLLDGSSPPLPPPPPSPPLSNPGAPAARARQARWLGPEPVIAAARLALSGRGPSVVLVGGEGVGKSALLLALLAETPGAARADLRRGEAVAPGTAPVLVDHLELASPTALSALSGRPFVAALRVVDPGAVRPIPLEALGEVVPLVEVALPAGLPLAVAVGVPAPDAAVLGQLLDGLAGDLQLPAELKRGLVQRALQSPRGARALEAELQLVRALSQRKAGP